LFLFRKSQNFTSSFGIKITPLASLLHCYPILLAPLSNRSFHNSPFPKFYANQSSAYHLAYFVRHDLLKVFRNKIFTFYRAFLASTNSSQVFQPNSHPESIFKKGRESKIKLKTEIPHLTFLPHFFPSLLTNPSFSSSAFLQTTHQAKTNQFYPIRPNPTNRPKRFLPILDYERFNCNSFNIRLKSWNYRGCWHQTCPLLASRSSIYPFLI